MTAWSTLLAASAVLVRLWCTPAKLADDPSAGWLTSWHRLYSTAEACEAARSRMRLQPSKRYPAGVVVDASATCICKGELPLGARSGEES